MNSVGRITCIIKDSSKLKFFTVLFGASVVLLTLGLFTPKASANHTINVGCANNNPTPFVSTNSSIGNGYMYRTYDFGTGNISTSNLGHVISSLCYVDNTETVFNGQQADQVYVGFHPNWKPTLSADPRFLNTTIPPDYPYASPPGYGASNGYHSAFVDDAGAMRLDSSYSYNVIWCTAMGSRISGIAGSGDPSSCGSDIYGGGVAPSASAYHGAAFLFSNNNRNGNSNGCDPITVTGFGTKDCSSAWQLWLTRYGTPASGSFTNVIRKNSQNYLENFNFYLLAKNTWPGGYGATNRITFRYPQKNASCTRSPSVLNLNTSQPASVAMNFTNNGRATWYRSQGSARNYHRLVSTGNSFSGLSNTIALSSSSVAAGGSSSHTMNFTAPSSPGTYTLRYQMQLVGTGGSNFGQSCAVTVNVTSPPPNLPSCDVRLPNTASINQGTAFTSIVRATFAGARPATITSASYNTTGSTVSNGSGNTTSAVPVTRTTGTADFSSRNNLTPVSSGTFTVNWTLQTSEGIVRCSRSYTVPSAPPVEPPTCTIIGNTAFSIGTPGRQFTVSVRNNEPGSGTSLSVTSATFNGSIVSGGASPSSTTIPATLTREFTSPTSGSLNSGGNITLTIVYNTATQNGLSSVMNCGSVTVQALDLVCTAASATFTPSDQIRVSISIRNPNPYLDLRAGDFNITMPGVFPGVRTVSGGNVGGSTIRSFESGDLGTAPPGTYTVNWSVQTGGANCDGVLSDMDADITISTEPYARFYGNDVFAGGGVGESCTSGSDIDALGFVNGNVNDSSTLTGTGVQLAVFAIGEIRGVQPQATRTGGNPKSLAFGNTISGTDVFGGDYGISACTDDYFARISDLTASVNNSISLNGGWDGSRLYDPAGDVLYINNSNISPGRNVEIYVDGDVYINNNIRMVGTATDIDDISSVYIITNGDVYIDHSVTNIDAVIIAQEGEIFTCSNPPNVNLTVSSNVNNLALNTVCQNQLTVNGAFMAEKVHLLRTFGSLDDPGVTVGEGPGSRQAETFIFSPDIYFARPSSLTTNIEQEIDSITSPPPSF